MNKPNQQDNYKDCGEGNGAPGRTTLAMCPHCSTQHIVGQSCPTFVSSSPHQEAWAERFEKRFSPIWLDLKAYKRNIKQFIRQELTTLHNADCERFRRMIESEKKNYDGFWQEIENMGKNANRHGPSSQAKVDGKEAFSRLLITALSKMEEEK